MNIRIISGSCRVLRLGNTVWNDGAGPLELLGEFIPTTKQTAVRQRLYMADGSSHECAVGEFVWHPGHDHWHFADFVLYELWSTTPRGGLDRVMASSNKLSYCLMDTNVVNRENPAFVWSIRYGGCAQSSQGLSAGWGDTYDSWLEGQSLDITGLPDGIYRLVSTTNPAARLVESNYDNNAAVLYVGIEGNRVSVVPFPTFDPPPCRAGGCAY